MERNDFLQNMIEEYKKKVALYLAMIEEWERELGRVPQTPGEPILGGEKGIAANHAPSASFDGAIQSYQFWGKSQTEAAKALLELKRHPLKTEQIMEGIEKGGVKVGGGSKSKRLANLYNVLRRSDDFAIVDRGAWGLTSWPGVKKKKQDAEGDTKNDTEPDK